MSTQPDPSNTFELAQNFRQFAQQVGNYLFDNWDKLNDAQRQQLSDLEADLLGSAASLNTQSVLQSAGLAQAELEQLVQVSETLRQYEARLASVKKVVELGISVLALLNALHAVKIEAIVQQTQQLGDLLE